MQPEQMHDTADVNEAVRSLYGVELSAARSVVHVTSVSREPDGSLRVIRVGAHAPKSAVDFFILRLTRARVEGIVVGGGVLEAEPELRFDLVGPAEHALAAWRRERALLCEPPWLLVLTRGERAAEWAGHPAWDSWVRPIVLTGADAALRLRRALPSRVEVVPHPAPSPRAAVAYLRDDRRCRGISIEAGPRVAVPLYERPPVVDELMLSVFEGPVAAQARGEPFLSEQTLARTLQCAGEPKRLEESSGSWSFSRWTR